MRRCIKAACTIILLFAFTCPLQAGPKPDLQATMGFNESTYMSGVKKCITWDPVCTVHNTGKVAITDGFDVKLEVRSTKESKWTRFFEYHVDGLDVGESKTWGPNPINAHSICFGDSRSYGFRFTVDHKKVIKEANEDNNSVTKFMKRWWVPKKMYKKQ